MQVSLFSHVALSATPVSAVAEWHAYLRNASRHLSGQPRHILVVATAGFGRSFSCPDSEVDDGSTCTFKCRSVHCTDAYALCIAHEECDVVELNAPRLSWATLKTGVQITSLHNRWRLTPAEGAPRPLTLTGCLKTCFPIAQWRRGR